MVRTLLSTSNSRDRWGGFPTVGALNAAVLLICILSVALCNYLVDPYNLRGVEGSHAEKKSVSYPRSYFHWKLAEFTHRSASVVFLGDSRMGSFYDANVDRMVSTFEDKSFDFSFGGGTLNECISAFWYANEKMALRRVYLGLNFNLLNDAWPANRCEPAIALIKSPFRYYLHPFISQVTIEILLQSPPSKWGAVGGSGMIVNPSGPWSYLLNRTFQQGNDHNVYPRENTLSQVVTAQHVLSSLPLPRQTQDSSVPTDASDFWEFQLSHRAHQQYSNYVYPQEGLLEIAKVASHCQSNGIELVLVYFPTHVDLQNRVADYDLTEAYLESKQALSGLAGVFDYDFANEVTSNRENFSDPYHFLPMVGRRMFDEVVLGKRWIAKLSGPQLPGAPN